MSGGPDRALKGDAQLFLSPTVANCAMNRGRGLALYARELPGFAVVEPWLDVACGEGRAAHEAAAQGLDVEGLDLVDFFRPGPATLHVGDVLRWTPPRRYRLITCVHGLHYVGDKLGALARMRSWLQKDGRLLAHLDPANLRGVQGLSLLRAAGFGYAQGVVSATHGAAGGFPARYLGADDEAGPNVTGMRAVDSWYAPTP